MKVDDRLLPHGPQDGVWNANELTLAARIRSRLWVPHGIEVTCNQGFQYMYVQTSCTPHPGPSLLVLCRQLCAFGGGSGGTKDARNLNPNLHPTPNWNLTTNPNWAYGHQMRTLARLPLGICVSKEASVRF